MIPNTQTSLVARFRLEHDDDGPNETELHRVVAWGDDGQPVILSETCERLLTCELHAHRASHDGCTVVFIGVIDLQRPRFEGHPRRDDEGQVFSDGAARFI